MCSFCVLLEEVQEEIKQKSAPRSLALAKGEGAFGSFGFFQEEGPLPLDLSELQVPNLREKFSIPGSFLVAPEGGPRTLDPFESTFGEDPFALVASSRNSLWFS
ncbi:hypothetical protein VNO77_19854 [Canavalia gladiata]|uniref:Uncharacterized protein n=1 Tax=Canavalia gladiata TaxID=3824 RepID=A0AAN9QIV3_CANGL